MLVAVGLSIAGVVVGAVISILISRHFYRRTFRYRLGIYCIGAHALLAEIEPEIRRVLRVEFLGKSVQDLTVLYLLVANEGVTAVADVDKPLTCQLLLSNSALAGEPEIIYVSPQGRDIHVHREQAISFSVDFSTLNPDEFFILKLVVDGNITYADFNWTISTENLPPNVHVESGDRVRLHAIRRDDHKGHTNSISASKALTFWAQRAYGSRFAVLVSRPLLLLSGLSVLLMVYFVVGYAAPAVNIINVMAVLVALLCGFSLSAAGFAGTVIALMSVSRPRKRFDIPEETVLRLNSNPKSAAWRPETPRPVTSKSDQPG